MGQEGFAMNIPLFEWIPVGTGGQPCSCHSETSRGEKLRNPSLLGCPW